MTTIKKILLTIFTNVVDFFIWFILVFIFFYIAKKGEDE